MPSKTKKRKTEKKKTQPVAVKKPSKSKPTAAVPSVVKAATQTVTIAKAKGRPMLTWVGKRPLTQVTAFPAQHIETFDPSGDAIRRKGSIWHDWAKAYPHGGLLFHGDNKEVLAHLLANGFRGKVNLICIDPPFDSGADYVRKVRLKGPSGEAELDGETYSLGEQIQYADIWANDNYLQFMYEKLLMLKELLVNNGAIFVHTDPRRSHHIQCLMDELFGVGSFQNEICWKRSPFAGSSKARAHRFPANHDVLLFYTKNDDFTFHHDYSSYSEDYLKRFKNPGNDPKGPYRLTLLKSYSQERFEQWQNEGRLVPPKKAGAGWSYKQYLSESKGVQADDFWERLGPEAEEIFESAGTAWGDVNLDNPMANIRTDYPTQKPEELLSRLIGCCSNIGDIVLDIFIGSGTTAAVAQKLGRRWIGCDINKGAIQTTSKRLQTIISEQITVEKEKGRQGELIPTGKIETLSPAQLSFAVYRVNDYDLQIQHNEAVNLACEHIGVTRTRTDAHFDGTLGKRLTKIVPFGHPLTLLDLEELKKELAARPDEERDVVLVCLGKETTVDAWLEDWNRMRRKGDVPNKIEVIELRTDPKYGKFFVHQPAKAKVDIRRNGDKLILEIKDFISPTIVERLKEQAGILTPQINDWRAMVDCIMIDAAYNGQVFNITVSDVPEKKSDLVTGRYELPATQGKSTVAVKIVDMLGEELLITKEV